MQLEVPLEERKEKEKGITKINWKKVFSTRDPGLTRYAIYAAQTEAGEKSTLLSPVSNITTVFDALAFRDSACSARPQHERKVNAF